MNMNISDVDDQSSVWISIKNIVYFYLYFNAASNGRKAKKQKPRRLKQSETRCFLPRRSCARVLRSAESSGSRWGQIW